MTSPVELVIEHTLQQHIPVLMHCPKGHLHPLGCSCGQDPYDHLEHVARAVARALQTSGLVEAGKPSSDGETHHNT